MTLHLLLEEKLGTITADQRELLGASCEDCERLLALIQGLLELTRIDCGRLELTLQEVDPAVLLSNALASNEAVFKNSGRSLHIETAIHPLPKIDADSLKIERIMGEFLKNAAMHGTAASAVTVGLVPVDGDLVRFSVRNQIERAFSDSEKERAFEPFFRRAGEGGTGLNLAICRALVLVHGGRIGIVSKGSEVEYFFELPRSQSTQPKGRDNG
jgi:signal transduction histidine kinase